MHMYNTFNKRGLIVADPYGGLLDNHLLQLLGTSLQRTEQEITDHLTVPPVFTFLYIFTENQLS